MYEKRDNCGIIAVGWIMIMGTITTMGNVRDTVMIMVMAMRKMEARRCLMV